MGTDGAIGRWLNPKRRNQAPTVDRGIRNARPIAQAGKPCCSRNWRMNVTRTGEVMCGVRWGLNDPSSRPAAPSCRNRWTHLATVRTLTP